MKSNKQRRAEIMAARTKRKRNRIERALSPNLQIALASGAVAVNETELPRSNSYGVPEWQARGYYLDLPFVCKDCGVHCVWTAQQQKWWYETARGYVDTTAVRCTPCRAKERARKQAARVASEAGRIRKMAG